MIKNDKEKREKEEKERRAKRAQTNSHTFCSCGSP